MREKRGACRDRYMDLLNHYIAQESDHISLLIKFLENREQQLEGVTFSNLFNFHANFQTGRIIIEDECGLFSKSASESSFELNFNELKARLANSS